MKDFQSPVALALALCLLCACGEPPKTADRASGSAAEAMTNIETERAPLRFEDVSESSGIQLENVSGDPIGKFAIPENIGQGAAAFDFDGDGDLDLFIANGDVLPGGTPRAEPRPALYRNDGDFRFTDVTREAGLWVRAWMHGAYAIDFDGDGDKDLYCTVFLGKNLFFRNDGGRFTDVSAEWGGDDPGPSSAAAFFDADGDGDLDLYVGNYVEYDPKNPPQGGNPCTWKGLAVSCGPHGMPAGKDRFYENQDGRLVEATAAFGFDTPAKYTLCIIAGDSDGDGKIDLFVANDSVDNYHFQNLGGGKFQDRAGSWETASSGAGHAQAGMGADFADFDRDGRLDLYVTHFSHDFNTLYRNEKTVSGATVFFDVTDILGLKAPTMRYLSWGTMLVDLNLDGWRDIVIASGHVYPQVDGANLGTSYAQRNQVFLSQGKAQGAEYPRFLEYEPKAGDPLGLERVSRGLVTADFDNDGDLDLVFIEMDGKPTVLRSNLKTTNAWVGFELVGGGKNTEAIGAKIEVTDATGIVHTDQRTYGESYFSTVDSRLHFGLGGARGPLSASLTWPSGAVQRFEGLQPNRYYQLKEGNNEARPQIGAR